ncbi:E3 ubiquitin-protein ligase arc-1-like [Saccostrea echinata]|uniref:E3 ubiquitin-protein ligase arc-1-like n=1 Tax=Saccostrea echinata TaxID=191078 RepID=UPI002A7FADE2|nr:E3 ubiquitin-protein ligase arc-1-like [Saccostrea echinata]
MNPQHSAQDVQRCEICDVAVVEMYCTSCPFNLCKTCVGNHLSDEPQKHKIIKYQDRKTVLIYPKCNIHPQDRCENYCEDCDIPVCSSCIASDLHERHKFPRIKQIFSKRKEFVKNDIKELEDVIYPSYKDIVQQLESDISNLEEEYKVMIQDIEKQGEQWHQTIDLIVKAKREETENMRKKQLGALKEQLRIFNQLLSRVQESIRSNKHILDSSDVSKSLSYSSSNDALKALPPKVNATTPRFSPKSINNEQISEMFGTINKFSITTQEHGYKLKALLDLSSTKENVIEEDTKENKKLLPEPAVTYIIETGYRDLGSIACLNDEEIWTSGFDNSLKLFKIAMPSHISRLSFGVLGSSVLKEVSTGVGYKDIAVTTTGELILCNRSANILKLTRNNKMDPMIKINGWIILNICITVRNELLAMMVNANKTQSKVVRFADSKEKQSIQFDHEGKPLFSSSTSSKYIRENKNTDICVADRDASVVVVTNNAGCLRFRYTGHDSTRENGTFSPAGIATDSQAHILVADTKNDCIHIIDENGQFLSHLFICKSPTGLAVDSNDNLYVAEKSFGKVKRIRYIWN